jgi:hypothetical protein
MVNNSLTFGLVYGFALNQLCVFDCVVELMPTGPNVTLKDIGATAMTKTPREQLSGLVKRQTMVKKRISAAAKTIKRGASMKNEDWYVRAQQRIAIASVGKEEPCLPQDVTDA